MNTRLLFVVSLALAACGGDEDNDAATCEPASGTLSGTVAGQPFELTVGETDSFLSDEETYFVSFYTEPLEACGSGFAEGPRILTVLPKAPGTYPLSFERSLTFAYDDNGTSQNDVSLWGVILVDAVTDTTITGSLCASMGEHEVSGAFVVTICD